MAGASFKLMVDEALGRRPRYFTLRDLTVVARVSELHSPELYDTTAILEIDVGGKVARTSAEGNGPVHAMDKGLRALIDAFYPSLKSVRLTDYKVRVLSSGDG